MVLDSNITSKQIAKEFKSPESMTASSKLLELSTAERESLGLVHTLREILQQPQTWRRTYEKVRSSYEYGRSRHPGARLFMDLFFAIRRQLGRSGSFRASFDSVSANQTPDSY